MADNSSHSTIKFEIKDIEIIRTYALKQASQIYL